MKTEKENKENQKALDKALFFILRRPHSEQELKQKLDKKFSEESITFAFIRLKEYGYLDDMEFAKAWIRERKKLRPKGKKALYFELLKKGVDKEIIETELSKIEESDECMEAENLLENKFSKYLEKKMNYQEKMELKAKIYSFLASRGYSYNVVKEAIRNKLDLKS